MGCTIYNFKINGDNAEQKIKKAIRDVSGNLMKKMLVMQEFFNNSNPQNTLYRDFQNYLYNRLTESDKERFAKNNITVNQAADLNVEAMTYVNANTLKSAISGYYNLTIRDTDNYNAKTNDDRLENWTSKTAKKASLVHVGEMLIEYKYIHLHDGVQPSDLKMKLDIIKQINRNYINNYLTPFVKSILNDNTFSKADKDIANKIIDTLKAIDEKGKNKEDRSVEISQLNSYIQILLGQVKNTSPQFTNYTELYFKVNLSENTNKEDKVKELNSKGKKFFEEVYRLPIFSAAARGLLHQNEGEIETDFDADDDGDVNNQGNDDSVDMMSKNWSDKQFKTFEQNVAGDVKMYLATVPYLSEPVAPGSTNYVYDTNNELGVAHNMHPKAVITQLASFARKGSIKEFIQSIRELSQTSPKLYGLGKLANDLENDYVLAHRVKSELSNTVIAKIQIAVIENARNLGISNPQSNRVTKTLFTLSNEAISNFDKEFRQSDLNTINDFRRKLNKTSNFILIDAKIYEILNKYFPSILKEDIERYLNKNNPIESRKEILNAIQGILSSISDFKDKYKEAVEADSKIKKEYNAFIEDLVNSDYNEELIKTKEKLESKLGSNVAALDYNKTFHNESFIKLARIVSGATYVDVQMNSYNADTHLASDLLPNSKITNLLEDIQYEELTNNGGKVMVGLNNLLNLIKDEPGYQYSSFFFGVKEGNRVISEGLFIRNQNGTISINPNARSIIKVALFDGIKNETNNTSAMYDKMSRGDYFMSIMQSFVNPVDYYDGNDISKRAGYFMRIPSDAPKNFIIQLAKYNGLNLFTEDGINTKNDLFIALKQVLKGEINDFVHGLNAISDIEHRQVRENIEDLYDNYHYQAYNDKDGNRIKGKVINNDTHRLTGRVFKFEKLFVTRDGYDINEDLISMLSLYGEDNTNLLQYKDGKLIINSDSVNWITTEDGRLKYLDNQIDDILNDVVSRWILSFDAEIKERAAEYSNLTEDIYNEETISEAMLNQVVAYNVFDDIFEGNSKFYPDARAVLKRAKESQASGSGYASYDLSKIQGSELIDLDELSIGDRTGIEVLKNHKVRTWNGTKYEDKVLTERTGWRGVTIKNVVRNSSRIDIIEKEVYETVKKYTGDEKLAEKRAKQIRKKYEKTKVDDAQSYITFEEFIRRRYADGTINQYKDLIEQVLSLPKNADGTYDTSSINLESFNARIMIQKNFYYDIYKDKQHNLSRPRQIKNAEFVLIPQLLDGASQLRQLYDAMIHYDIGQVNTTETSKAAKKHVLTLWDNDGNFHINEFRAELERGRGIENYYYRYLYKQQDIPQHLVNKENRAGIQIMKKVADNLSNADEAIQDHAKRFFEAYSANIKIDFEDFLDKMGWELKDNKVVDKESHKFVTIDGETLALNSERFYAKALEECSRLGLDSNFLDYVVPDEFGVPSMPNYMNNVASKLESIAQSLFNNNITRQKLPGWHAAEFAGVGLDRKLRFHPDTYYGRKTISKDKYEALSEEAKKEYKYDSSSKLYVTKYRTIEKEEYDKLSKEEKDKYRKQSYMEGAIALWFTLDKLKKAGIKPTKEEILKKLDESGCDIHITYRIPTEGKQSVDTCKIVTLLDSIYDSAFASADEWVAKTGADKDGDSVYAIVPEFEIRITDGGTDWYIDKVSYNLGERDYDYRTRYKDYIVKAKGVTKEDRKEINAEKDNAKKNEIIDKIAKTHNLISFEEFREKPLMEQLNSKQRNNVIYDSIVAILTDSASREELFSSSNFDDLTASMKKYDELRGATAQSRSPYNPFDQIDYMENAIAGRNIKAFSVTRDTFNSIANKAHAIINSKYNIRIAYDAKSRNIDTLKERFGENFVTEFNESVIITHNKWAWSNDNRNIDGELITVYSSETTANILDAIKEGTVYNENEYTFGVFKTLVDIGSNYDTAISFLMNPAITAINTAYFRTKSIYNNVSGNPITNAYKTTAIKLLNALGIKDKKGKEFTENTPINTIRTVLNKNQKVIERAKVLSQNPALTKLEDGNYIISEKLLSDRLKHVAENVETINDLIFDLTTIVTFQKLKNLANNVEKIARCSSPDKFGAKQSIHETRTVIDNINKYSNYKSVVGNTLTVQEKDGKVVPFLDSLYGENSPYPYMKAFKENATDRSIEINGTLFDLESDDYNTILKGFEQRLGRKLTEDEYKVYKQYLVSSFYSQIDVLEEPITVNIADGNLYIIRDDIRKELYMNSDEGIYRKEKNRIYGYTEDISSDKVIVKDLNNPTEKELDLFNQLTPAQKVLWIQSHFIHGKGVFEYLEARTFNYAQYKNKKYSSNRILLNADNIERDDLIQMFENAFFSHNALIRLTAIDLIKYATIVEGFNFKSKSISKIIANNTLKNYNFEDNIFGDLVTQLKSKVNGATADSLETFMDNFVRSHPEYTKEVIVRNSHNGESLLALFNSCETIKGSKIYKIPATDKYQSLREEFFDTEDIPTYFRVTSKIKNGKTTYSNTILYKLYRYDEETGDVYLYPLDLLEANENAEQSINPTFSKFYSQEYYKYLIDKAIELSMPISEFTKTGEGAEYIEAADDLKHTRRIYNKIVRKASEIDTLSNIAEHDSNPIQRNETKKFIDKILDAINDNSTNISSYKFIYYPGINVSQLFDKKKTNIQKLVDKEGNDIYVAITKTSPNRKRMKHKGESYVTYPVEERAAIKEAEDAKAVYPIYYKLQVVPEEDIDIRHSSTSGFADIDITSSSASSFSDITKSASIIIDDIIKKDRPDFAFERELFYNRLRKNGIKTYEVASINENLIATYSSLANYYRMISDKIQENINNFTTSTGEKYAIDDPELYKYLIDHDEDYQRLLRTILDAKTLAKGIQKYLDIDVTSEDESVRRSFNTIKNSINKIKNNSKVKDAINLLYNVYFAQKFSNNPNIQNGLLAVTEAFGDTNKFDLLFSDIGELNNKQVQLVAKYAYAIMSEANQIVAPRLVNDFKAEFDSIMKNNNVNTDNIIDKNGRFVQVYDESFTKEYEKLADEVEAARMSPNDGMNSIRYIKAKLAFDKFRAENMHQKVKAEYYIKDVAQREKVVEQALPLFAKYQQLIYDMYDINKILPDKESETARRIKISNIIKDLKSIENPDGTLKDKETRRMIEVLKEYIKNHKHLRETYFKEINDEYFDINLEYYKRIIENYKKAHPSETLDMRLQNDEYREAHNWIKSNTTYTIPQSVSMAIGNAFAQLRNTNTPNNLAMLKLRGIKNIYDELGTIDGRLITDEEKAAIKKDILDRRKTSVNSIEGDANLIKETGIVEEALNDKFYNIMNGIPLSDELKELKMNTISRINELISAGLDAQGHLSSKLLFDNLTFEELTELAELYKTLKKIKSPKKTKEQVQSMHTIADFKSNDIAFQQEWVYYKTTLAKTNKANLWRKIFMDYYFDENGAYVLNTDKDSMQPKANTNIYGYIQVKEQYRDRYINKPKQDAIKFLDENVQFETTEYYESEAYKHAGDKEWFEKNHVYNHYTHKWEPLPIWTHMVINPGSKFAESIDYEPSGESVDVVPREGMENPEYNQHYKNYNDKAWKYDKEAHEVVRSNTNKYNNSKYNTLNTDERRMLELLQNTIKHFSLGHGAAQFFDNGFAPMRYKEKVDGQFFVNEAVAALGLSFRNNGRTDWYDDLEYANDREIGFNMAHLFHTKDMISKKQIPARLANETEEEYFNRAKPYLDANKKIDAENDKIRQNYIDRDWRSVFSDFIERAVDYEARNKIKNSLYITLESLEQNDAYYIDFKGKVNKNEHSRFDNASYKTTPQTNTYEIFQNWARRILFKQYKENSIFRDLANTLQAMTSAKYMILNVTGGISNVTTGWVNIAGETFAGTHFTHKDWLEGNKDYMNNVLGFIANSWTSDTDKGTGNKYIELTKLFDVVDYDAMLERRPNETVTEYARKFRDSLYGLQSGGEHYMQNAVLFAMLKSNRIYKDIEGKISIGTFRDYTRNLEFTALSNVLDESLQARLVQYKNEVINDLNKRNNIDSLKHDYAMDFIMMINDKELTKKYIETRKTLLKDAQNKFNEFATLESAFVMDNETGRLKLNKDTGLTDYMIGEFRTNVIQVNKKIHGVYDKLGAASIERKWWGSLVMQYHKHLYPGIMKRWRGLFNTRGYFNELRSAEDYGSYMSLAKLLSFEFRRANLILTERKNLKYTSLDYNADNEITALDSIKQYGLALINTFTNFATNYQTMPEWEKANIRRTFGDLSGIGAAFMLAMVLYMLWDDDDVKESDALATCLYLADRLASESKMYTISGLISEGQTLWSSPIAMTNTIEDMAQCLTIVNRWIWDPDFDINYSSGIYKGENKLIVKLRRNIPAYRVYDRLSHMSKNNSYYRIGNTRSTIKLARNIAGVVNPDE